MSIGTNIYTLRKAKKLTQGQLAEKIGVSEQAVSKWENGLCAPDVSLFPILAGFFGVSIDHLFGFHLNSYSDEVEQIMKAADDSQNTYKEIEIISEGLQRYPNSPDLKIYLAFSLSMVNRFSKDENERKEAVKKALDLCNEVVNTCGDVEMVDRAFNMLRRIYCEIGEYQKALDAIDRISAQGYMHRVVGQAQVLAYSKDYAEHAKFTEENLWRCYLAMDSLLELKINSLTETKEYEKVPVWCSARQKLLSVFDDGCPDFYISHKLWNCNAKAQAYKKMGEKGKCLEELRNFVDCTKYFKPDAKGEYYQLAARNPIYFSNISDPGSQEEYMTAIYFDKWLSGYDKFFGDDAEYLQFKKGLVD
ncbi:MAG: helix-turn-helix transcriptional regulator [Clostridia bacterium]|nr:helix-turn-helix transcriptional regulator [Clostridia bacterium]